MLRKSIVLLCLSLFAVTLSAQQKGISLNMQNTSIEKVLREIEKQSAYRFIYSNEVIDVDQTVSITTRNQSLDNVLNTLFRGKDIRFDVRDNRVLLKKIETPTPKEEEPLRRLVSGKIVDDQGLELPGATIMVKETKRGGVADVNGEFSMWLMPDEKHLIFSYVGMDSQEVNVTRKNVFTVKLRPVDGILEEVVVTGYQTISKERATGAYAIVTPSNIKGKMQSNIITRLEGQVPGLLQQQNGEITIRGISTLRNGERKPLIVVDGMPFEGEIQSINPAIIKNVTVLKDAAAASIYGARAANGIIVISTIQGSMDGKTRVSYDGSINFTPKPNLSYFDLLNSEELVDLQANWFHLRTNKYESLNKRRTINPVEELLYKHKSKLISDEELANGLDYYKTLDNRNQLKDFYLQTGISHQHNISLSGGNDKNRYVASVNYSGDRSINRYSSNERLGFNVRNNMKFFEWLQGDLGISGNMTKDMGDTGMGSFISFFQGRPSYMMIRDSEGNPLNIPQNKSVYELERLKSIGLNDEYYSPIRNRAEESYRNIVNYYRIQMGLNFKLMQGLNLDVKYQTELSNGKNRDLYSKNSYFVKNLVNDAAQYNSKDNTIVYNIPNGGQLGEVRTDSYSYTFRTQLNYMKEIDKHFITALAGAERRLLRRTGTSNYYFGYDDSSLGYKLYNQLILQPITKTEALGGQLNWNPAKYNEIAYKEDRFVSFYANASYTYDQKYNLSGSIRMDQSNLFGTDPKYQYRPLWSLGGSWDISQEEFMKPSSWWLDRLNLRLTYGIGGNIPKNSGPYLTIKAPSYSAWVNDFGSSIEYPPNPALRWEKTATTNVGLDFGLWKSRITGSIDFYKKYTTDMLANREADPTLGWDQLMLNYGSMVNRGVELSLTSQNVASKAFSWSTTFNFAVNRNKLLDVNETNLTTLYYTQGNAAVEGYPLDAVFSFQYAGLSPEDGTPLYYSIKGEGDDTHIEKEAYIQSIRDVVYSGTTTPVYSSSLTNRFSFKNIDLSFMLVYYGGHVLRKEAAPYLSYAPTTNVSREILNAWTKPGDELKSNATPTIVGHSLYLEYDLHQWAAADKQVVRGDYIKLRDVTLSYNFGKSLISKWGMESFALMLQVENLGKIVFNNHGVDPEAMSIKGYGWGAKTFPIPTTCTIGISAKF